MGKLEILAQINVLNQKMFSIEKKIGILEEEKTKYTNLIEQISEICNELGIARYNVRTSSINLHYSYSSSIASKKSCDLESSCNKIESIIKNLNKIQSNGGEKMIELVKQMDIKKKELTEIIVQIKRLSRDLNKLTN